MSDYDLTKNPNHPLGWSDDPRTRGQEERRVFGSGNQAPQQPSESWGEYQDRISGK